MSCSFCLMSERTSGSTWLGSLLMHNFKVITLAHMSAWAGTHVAIWLGITTTTLSDCIVLAQQLLMHNFKVNLHRQAHM